MDYTMMHGSTNIKNETIVDIGLFCTIRSVKEELP